MRTSPCLLTLAVNIIVVGSRAALAASSSAAARDSDAWPCWGCTRPHSQGPDLLQAYPLSTSRPSVSAPLAAEAIQSGRINNVASPGSPPARPGQLGTGWRGPEGEQPSPGDRRALCRPPRVSDRACSACPVLTGLLNDGRRGPVGGAVLGGITVVQDPDEAAYPDMPSAALTTMAVDHRLPSCWPRSHSLSSACAGSMRLWRRARHRPSLGASDHSLRWQTI